MVYKGGGDCHKTLRLRKSLGDDGGKWDLRGDRSLNGP